MDNSILYDIKRYSTWVNEIDLNKVIHIFWLTKSNFEVYFEQKGHYNPNKTKKFTGKLL
jgi:hypothetical protein